MNEDPREIIARTPMRALQIGIVAICIALNALDGFDVLAISFAAPGIAEEWGVDKAMLGVVLSMELFGMAAGSVLIGNLADRIGRRPTILLCLVVMAIGMFAATLAAGVTMLSTIRFLTGIGIGGMLSSTSAMVAEFSNDRRRGLAMALNIAGYSTGAILGGLLASHLLAATGDWRSVFMLGAIATTAMIPLAILFLPESIESLIARRPTRALDRVNMTMRRLGRPEAGALPPPPEREINPTVASLFSSDYGRVTTLLTIAYFAQILFFYYIQKWIPKIVVDMGFDPSQAGGVLVAANVGNLAGALAIGLASQRVPLRPLVGGSMLAGFAAIGLFGIVGADLTRLAISAAIAAFFINAGVVGMYPIFAQAYPAALRASGTGLVIGIGRGGSALGPVVAGALFSSGSSLLVVSLTMGLGGLVAATMIFLLPRSLNNQVTGPR
ncbi:MFS transporter [Sphingopyxis sp. 113P3]|uniref:MFS transporter n=1 Tax=Sphingopyxis sp. (strain 113P3) TaxID=292913 RepID=UPI0006AD1D11|nr:MFS transporter [Sphingopyxis sp. 113P3]ALC14088.1 MFS transporter [Sphingopyxis sp. 113P3]